MFVMMIELKAAGASFSAARRIGSCPALGYHTSWEFVPGGCDESDYLEDIHRARSGSGTVAFAVNLMLRSRGGSGPS